jgi:hypothetical protein
MRRQARGMCFGLAGIVLVLAGGTGRAQDPAFRMQGAGEGQVTAAGFSFVAAGEATQLGKWTNSGEVAILGPDPTTPGNLAVVGEVAFTAANGDRLYAVITGSLDPATGAGLGVFHWDGGTGRFAGATGSAVFPVQNSPVGAGGGFAFAFTAAGTLDF